MRISDWSSGVLFRSSGCGRSWQARVKIVESRTFTVGRAYAPDLQWGADDPLHFRPAPGPLAAGDHPAVRRLPRQPGARRRGRLAEHPHELQSLMRSSYAVTRLKTRTTYASHLPTS